MSTTSAPLTDSRIMLRRNFKHILRNPVTIFNGTLMPVVLMLLLVYVFGNAFNVGERYIEYATPGLILLAITYGLSATAVSVSSDMTKGIINRFKVMNVSRGAVLTGHVVATMLISSVAIAVIIGMAFALGFRSPATPLDWLGAIGIIAATAFAAAWLTVALGMAAKTPESAGLSTVLLILLPFGLLLPFRLRRLFLFRSFTLFFLFIRLALPRVNRRGHPEDQKKRRGTDDSNWSHLLSPLNFFLSPPREI